MAGLLKVRDYTVAELEKDAIDIRGGAWMGYICGRLLSKTLGGMVFESTDGAENGTTTKIFTTAEIQQAPYRNYQFIERRDSGQYNDLPDPPGKFVMPYAVAQDFGVV